MVYVLIEQSREYEACPIRHLYKHGTSNSNGPLWTNKNGPFQTAFGFNISKKKNSA